MFSIHRKYSLRDVRQSHNSSVAGVVGLRSALSASRHLDTYYFGKLERCSNPLSNHIFLKIYDIGLDSNRKYPLRE